jgi:ADP-ribosylglycohydrolase
MLGAIAGDIVGSAYERRPLKSESFPLFSSSSRFTDDSVLTVAQMDQILHGLRWKKTLVEWFHLFPQAGYGGSFAKWCLQGGGEPYGSWGNGSAMRVSPVGWAYDTLEEVLQKAEESAVATHSHPEGIKGAQAVAGAIFWARTGSTKEEIRRALQKRFGYDLGRTLEEIRPEYHFDVSCQGSVPEALVAFFESRDVEDAVRKAVSLGGDSDTQACIAGSVAEAFYRDIPFGLVAEVWKRLHETLQNTVRSFYQRYRPEVQLP